MEREILYSIDDDIGVLTINRPQVRNALNWSAQEQFAAIIDEAALKNDLRVLIITGQSDQAFASGGDQRELAGNEDRETGERLASGMGEALNKLTKLPLPVIGAVNGDAVGGGCEILTACDLRISSPQARFRFAQIQVALTTGWGGTARLTRLVGLSRAMELLLMGRWFSADEAQALGFVHRLTAGSETVLGKALEWAKEMRRMPAGALAAAKRLAWESSDLILPDAYQLERELFLKLWPKRDHQEAAAAFLEKRQPIFNSSLK